MGEGVQVGRGGTDNGSLIEHFLRLCFSRSAYMRQIEPILLTDDIVTTTIASLNAISRSKRSPFRPVFLLNNISYLRQNLLLEPSDDAISSLISPATSEALKSAFRTAKAAYFDSNLSPLMQVLTEHPKDEMNRAVVKDKFTKFFVLLDEVVERHRLAKVLEDDPKARKEIEDETVMLVVPLFRLFMQKHKEFSRSTLIFFRISVTSAYILQQIHRNVGQLSDTISMVFMIPVFRHQTDCRGCRGAAQRFILCYILNLSSNFHICVCQDVQFGKLNASLTRSMWCNFHTT